MALITVTLCDASGDEFSKLNFIAFVHFWTSSLETKMCDPKGRAAKVYCDAKPLVILAAAGKLKSFMLSRRNEPKLINFMANSGDILRNFNYAEESLSLRIARIYQQEKICKPYSNPALCQKASEYKRRSGTSNWIRGSYIKIKYSRLKFSYFHFSGVLKKLFFYSNTIK